MTPSLDELRAFIDRGWIGVPGTTLRREDEKKARELVGFLREATFLLDRDRAGRSRELRVVDAAAGKGYVGIALAQREGLHVTLLERDAGRVAAMVAACHALAIPLERIDARAADVGDQSAWPAAPDLVVSLHACGNATDLVIEHVVAARARAVLIAPCCVAGDLPAARRAQSRAEAAGLNRHAEIRRRIVEAHVLAERVLRLESSGYKVELVPFAAPTVTPYNVAIRALVSREPERIARTRSTLARLRGDGESNDTGGGAGNGNGNGND